MEQLALVASCFVILISLLLYRSYRARSQLPPGPWSLPLIGHLHLLVKSPPHKAFQSIASKYGPIVYLKLGMSPTVVISSPQLTKELFTMHDATCSSRPYLVIGEHITYGGLGVATAPYGEHWRKVRKVCAMELFTTKCIESFFWIRDEELNHAVKVVQECHRSNRPVDLRTVLFNSAFNNMTRILMSKRYFGTVEDVAPEAVEFKEFVKEVMSLTISPRFSHFVPPYLRWLDWDIPRYKHIHTRQDKFLQNIIEEHKSSKREYQDFVDIMLQFFQDTPEPETYTKANLVEMVIAGTDTTAVTSEWLMAAVIHHPDVLRKVQEEMKEVVGENRLVSESDLPKLEYFQAAIKETLRCYPAGVLLIPRIASQDTRIGGYLVPEGTTLIVSNWALQMDPGSWEDPEVFNPQRFMKNDTVDYKGQSFELLPFGSGRRRCPGLSLGMRTVELVVANLIHGFHWRATSNSSMEAIFSSVNELKNPLHAWATPKLPKEVFAAT